MKRADQFQSGNQTLHPLFDVEADRWVTVDHVEQTGRKVWGTTEPMIRLVLRDGGVAKSMEIPASRMLVTR